MTTKIFEIYQKLLDIPTVSGYESHNATRLIELAKEYLGESADSIEATQHGSIVIKKGNGGLLVDAHIDTIGMTVSEILDGGFLRCIANGGIDSRILPSTEVEIHAKDTIRGIFCSVPPHLQKGKSGEAPSLADMYIDTGRDTEELKRIVKIGTQVSFLRRARRLCNNTISGAYLDDKLCVASAIYGLSMIEGDSPCEYTLVLASGEESNGSGACYGARLNARAALVLDVNFASRKGVDEYVSAPIGKGISISYSAATSKRFTTFVEDIAKKESIPYKLIIEACDTGTDATRLAMAGFGTPCAVASIPIAYMHTPVETASLDDAQALARLVCETTKSFYYSDAFLEKRYIK